MVTATGPTLNSSEDKVRVSGRGVDQHKRDDEGHCGAGGDDRAKTRSKKARHVCRVTILDGSTIEVELGKGPTGRDAFDEAAKKLNLLEKDYFGLCYPDAQNRRVMF
ncbi:unnamed protein product [Soboliphyme baturini]|uniref:FERM domain-containing protein n=1 Tax=Soboliphyme baturini TaxID=241478 RepID=A0A183IRI6_9BILA|nr:unnamed protein product [Soboliphyme baturini]